MVDSPTRFDTVLNRVRASIYGSRRTQIALMILVDGVVVAVATALALYLRFEGLVPHIYQRFAIPVTVVALIIYVGLMWLNHLYHMVLRHVGIEMIVRLARSVFIGAVLLLAMDFAVSAWYGERLFPIGVLLIQGVLVFLGFAVLRSMGRLAVVVGRTDNVSSTRVLIVGAGDAGSLLLRDIENQPDLGLRVVGFLDDDQAKRGMSVRGVKVLGSVDELVHTVATLSVDEIFVAIPSMTTMRKRLILDECTNAGVKTRIVAGIAAESAFTGLADLRQVSVDDLLGREPVNIDVELITKSIEGKVVAVTGAAGSIGSELCRQLLKMHPKSLLLLEIDESRLYEMYLECEFAAPGIAEMYICDVRDDRKLDHVFARKRPNIVFHAAAYKHVPLMESEPDEAVRANIAGTMNVLMACQHNEVEHFVLISTDKAVEPANIMGATKAVAERVMIAAARSGVRGTAVRFGNVLGSRGSVVPIIEEQLRRGGPVRVTHSEMTRYFMTIPEAARLVLQAQAMSDGGEIFVLDMGEPVRILDLARRMIVLSGVPASIEFTGLRPGEKMHEVLVHRDSELLSTQCPAVMQLSCLPYVGDGFGEEVRTLVREARIGDSPVVVPLLARLSGAVFGVR